MATLPRWASLTLAVALAVGTVGFGPTAAAAAGAAAPESCVSAPSTPEKSPTGVAVRSVATNDCTVYAIFWLMRYESTDTGWRTVLERWMDPGTVNRLDFPCRASGTWSYRAVVWDPNMMGYLTSPEARITC
ncbi:hypothetical protein AB0D32_29175 [Micromonospora sp. NPDC048170]|uniref:hypothetical protein n=1 Tax=Micromonospora sp. NPDC048170 TaxID=3154819 RepID=UPI0033FC8689